MKNILILIVAILLSGCATNFNNYTEWKAAKVDHPICAEVIESRVYDGKIYGTAMLCRDNNEVRKFHLDPYIKTHEPIKAGFVVFIEDDSYQLPKQ